MNIASLIAGFLSGLLGAMGLGGGSVLILYLTLWVHMAQSQAQGINLTFFLPCAAIAVFLHSRKKNIRWSLWIFAAPAGMIAALLGTYLAQWIGGAFLQKIFAVFLTVFGLTELLHRKKSTSD